MILWNRSGRTKANHIKHPVFEARTSQTRSDVVPVGRCVCVCQIFSYPVDLVTADKVVAETEVVTCGSVIRWVFHGHAARLVHHPAFLGSAFTLPATENLPTVSTHCQKEKIQSRFGHSPHLSPSLKLSSWTLKMFTRTLAAFFM